MRILQRITGWFGLPRTGHGPSGGALTARPPGSADEHLIRLSEGKQITDPDEAEALGLTADARRMRADDAEGSGFTVDPHAPSLEFRVNAADGASLRGLLEHVGIDTSGGITVDGREVTAASCASAYETGFHGLAHCSREAGHPGVHEGPAGGTSYTWPDHCHATAATADMSFGPCIKTAEHADWHEDADGSCWTEGSEPGDSVTASDTLPAWLYRRFMPDGTGWERLDDGQRAYWDHQARAVRRAVARGGFRTVTEDSVSVPRDALRRLVKVAQRAAVQRTGHVTPAEYDAQCVLEVLDDAGLLDQFRGNGDG